MEEELFNGDYFLQIFTRSPHVVEVEDVLGIQFFNIDSEYIYTGLRESLDAISPASQIREISRDGVDCEIRNFFHGIRGVPKHTPTSGDVGKLFMKCKKSGLVDPQLIEIQFRLPYLGQYDRALDTVQFIETEVFEEMKARLKSLVNHLLKFISAKEFRYSVAFIVSESLSKAAGYEFRAADDRDPIAENIFKYVGIRR